MALAALIDAIQPGPEDVMITLGDYINRGPDTGASSTSSSAWAGAVGCSPLLGNHDQVLLDIWAGRCRASTLIRMGGLATLDSYGLAEVLTTSRGSISAFLAGCRD